MRTISTGEPSTLGTYREIAVGLYGEESEAVKYLDERIATSPNGADEEVIADEGQVMYLLAQLYLGGKSDQQPG